MRHYEFFEKVRELTIEKCVTIEDSEYKRKRQLVRVPKQLRTDEKKEKENMNNNVLAYYGGIYI